MGAWDGFWSYVHADDEAEGGRICRLATDVRLQFEMLTGETINLFLDRDAIKWGEDWREKIDEGLASVAFFIPVLTPRYFMSAECRGELQCFARRATDLGIKDLVLPLLYVDVASMHEESSTDDLASLAKTFQWEDWRDLRFEDLGSQGYRKAVARLAERLVQANMRAEEVDIATRVQELEAPVCDDADTTPGLVDRLAAMEKALPRWTEITQSISENIVVIGEIMRQGTSDIEKADGQGKGFAGRLTVARKVALQLRDPADAIWSSASEYVSELHEVDEGVRIVIDLAPSELDSNPESRSDVCGFFESLRELSASAGQAFDGVRQMSESIGPLEAMSRDLRPPLRRLRQGLTVMLEARKITEEWVRLVDSAGLECDEEEPSDS